MAHRSMLFASLTVLPILISSSRGSGTSRASSVAPNIVLIVLDDPNPSHSSLEGYTSQIHAMPTIDALAEHGILFRNGQTCPRCAQAVTQLLSGRECMNTQICWNENAPTTVPDWTIPKALRHAPEPYLTFGQGKGVILDTDPNNTMEVFQYGNHDLALWRDPNAPAWTAEMEAFMQVPDNGKPRFMWVMPNMPHVPWDHSLSTEDLKPLITVPPGVTDAEAFKVAEEQQLKMTQYTDARLSEFLAVLNTRFINDDRDTAVILVVGDNGFANGLISKGSPYEAGVRSLVIFSSVQNPRGAILPYTVPISTLDVSQTILKLANFNLFLPQAFRCLGKSLLPLLRANPQSPRDWIAATGRDTVYSPAFPSGRTQASTACHAATPAEDVYAICGDYVDTQGTRWKYILWTKEVHEGLTDSIPCSGLTPVVGTESVGIYHDFVSFGQRAAQSEELYMMGNVDDDASNIVVESMNVASGYPNIVQHLRCGAYQWWVDHGGTPLVPHCP